MHDDAVDIVVDMAASASVDARVDLGTTERDPNWVPLSMSIGCCEACIYIWANMGVEIMGQNMGVEIMGQNMRVENMGKEMGKKWGQRWKRNRENNVSRNGNT